MLHTLFLLDVKVTKLEEADRLPRAAVDRDAAGPPHWVTGVRLRNVPALLT